MPITTVRLAPVHGPGKARTAALIRLARQPLIPLPRRGRHSIGFILLDDALRAIRQLGRTPGGRVVSVGAGWTPIRDLLHGIALAQGRTPTWMPLPIPENVARRLCTLDLPERAQWVLRLAVPRSVEMEAPVAVTPLARAAAMLVAPC